MSSLGKFLFSNAKSLVSSELKGAAKKLIFKVRERSAEDLEKEVVAKIGYSSTYFKVSKDQKVVFSPSSVFFREWLYNCPEVKDSVIKDEETGAIYFNDQLLTKSKRDAIIRQFTTMTSIKTAGIESYFDNATKHLEPTDFTSRKFEKALAGWDPNAPSIIDLFLDNLFGPDFSDDPEFSSKLFHKWIVGTARRAIEPGVPLDGCLLLQGKPAIGKTAFFRNLLPEPFDKRSGQIKADVKNAQKFLENILGTTISTFDELSVFEHAKSLETFKSLISSQEITVRLPYRRDSQRYELRQGFAATTNHFQFIPDPYLSRRLWTIALKDTAKLDFDYLFANRKSLWQEAVYRAKNGEQYLLNPDEQIALERQNQKHLR